MTDRLTTVPVAPPAPGGPPRLAPPGPLSRTDPFWPDPQPAERHPRLLAAGLGVGTLTAVLLTPDARTGLAGTLVALAVLAVGVATLGRRRQREDVPVLGLVGLLAVTGLVTTADWAVWLCLVAGSVVLLGTLTGARTVSGFAVLGVTAPFALLVRGLGWVGRSVPQPRSATGATGSVWPVLRTLGLSAVLVLVFGSLFASADQVFASWTTGVLARFDLGEVPIRLVLGGLVTAVVLTAVVMTVLPPDVDRFSRVSKPAVRRWEWLGPVTAVGGVFLVFLAAQARGLFGGPAYLRSIGVSHAEWVHQGFGQLVAATAVVLVVVGVAARRASRRTVADRRWRQGALGGLCVLALVVAGSALHRLFLYDQAYGATRLRLLVAAFELWVVLVLLLAATVCVRLRGRWVPWVALLLGAALLGGLTLAGPDRLVAERNVTRFETTGQVDWQYLQSLSAEATPALDRLPEPYRSCALRGPDPWLETEVRRPLDANLADARARALLAEHPVTPVDCASLPSR